MSRNAFLLTSALLVLSVWRVSPALALEQVTALVADERREIEGQVLVEGAKGGLVLKTADGAYHRLLPDQILSRSTSDQPLVMHDRDALAEQLREEFPPDFQLHQSQHYVVCYNTTRSYAQWTSSLLERLHDAFISYWNKRGADVASPEHPLVVLVFADQASYARYSKRELGPAVRSVIGYYSFASNRIVTYDLTGMQALKRESGRRGSLRDITQLLSDPDAEPLVATIVHEATHQISFNCGLQTREVDNPLWLSEGLAEFFETPDLSSKRSWRGVGRVNSARWNRFRENYNRNQTFRLEKMIADDRLFREPNTALDAYAQAWAWNYFLIRTRPDEFVAYLATIASKQLLVKDGPSQRIADFQQHFGDDFDQLEADFYRHMARIK